MGSLPSAICYLLERCFFFSDPVDQDLSYLGAGEFGRKHFAALEHLAHLRAAQDDMILFAMRARLGRNDAAALFAIKGVLEFERRDADLFGSEIVKHQLRVVGAIIVAHAGVIAPDDHVRAAVIFAAEGVEYSFAR